LEATTVDSTIQQESPSMSLEQTQKIIHLKEQNQMHPKHWTKRNGNPHPKRIKVKVQSWNEQKW
jgi:hypothetical protein